MNKVYYLPHCKTCQKTLKELEIDGDNFELQNIKEKHISPSELDMLKDQAGSYENLFNRRSMKYRSMNLKEKNISEEEYRELILGEYTFLKRPTIVINNKLFIATTKKQIESAKQELNLA